MFIVFNEPKFGWFEDSSTLLPTSSSRSIAFSVSTFSLITGSFCSSRSDFSESSSLFLCDFLCSFSFFLAFFSFFLIFLSFLLTFFWLRISSTFLSASSLRSIGFSRSTFLSSSGSRSFTSGARFIDLLGMISSFIYN